MGLEDIYYRQPWTPNQGLGGQIDRAGESIARVPMANAQLQAQQQANTDAAYNSPAREANPHEAAVGSYIQNLMESHPNYQPGFKERLQQEMSQGGLTAPAAPPPSPGQGLGVPSDAPRGDAGDMRSGGQGLMAAATSEAPLSMNGEPMRRPLPAAAAFAAQRNAPPPVTIVPPPVRSQVPMTRGDVDTYMRMAPIFNSQKPQRDYMGELTARARYAQELEGIRQQGRVSIKDITNGQRTLEMATRMAMDQQNLDERTKYHINQINLGYARIQALQSALERNIDFKKTQGGDEILKQAVKTIDSMTQSRAALIGSAFASTPEGQQALDIMDQVTSKTLPIIQQRMDDDQASKGGQPAGPAGTAGPTIVPSAPPTTTVKGTSRFEQARIPGTVKPTTPPTAPGQTPEVPIRVRLLGDYKGNKKGSTGTINASEFDPNYMEKI
jgi:hypothetical protein